MCVMLFGRQNLLTVLWGAALPAYFGAVNGVTDDGTPVGNLPYAGVSFALASLAVLSVATEKAPESIAEEGVCFTKLTENVTVFG